MKRSPGPWSLAVNDRGYATEVTDANGEVVVDLAGLPEDAGVEADVALIAAAPEALDLLMRAADALTASRGQWDMRDDIDREVRDEVDATFQAVVTFLERLDG